MSKMNHSPFNRASIYILLSVSALFLVSGPIATRAKTFTVVGYNVENLFDLKVDSTEYSEYVPGGLYGWNRDMLDIKCDNIARVIRDMDADIVALQEVESRQALECLRDRLAKMGLDYVHAAIADAKPTAVKCAMLSKIPMVAVSEIPVEGAGARSILKVIADINGYPLIVYVNHWKSKFGPESQRIAYAEALAKDIGKLDAAADFILIGDFNSDYNEFETFRDSKKFNDTSGIAGINHLLNTIKGDRLVDETLLIGQPDNQYLYNLWLEIPAHRRWSVNFYGRKNSPDAIIVPKGLYDGKGIAYVDNSFDRFDPQYLFQNGAPYRWQRAENGRGKHIGRGYSDHLPVYAQFTSRPFQWADATPPEDEFLQTVKISDLYDDQPGRAAYRIRAALVIYKHKDSAVIKQKNGRSIYVYRAAKALKTGAVYDMTVTALQRFHGNLQVTAIADLVLVDIIGKKERASYYLFDPDADLSDPLLSNEVIGKITGVYRNGWFHYRAKRKIRLYFAEKTLKPETGGRMVIRNARIGFFDGPEIVIEKSGQLIGPR
jgi:exonuclease III